MKKGVFTALVILSVILLTSCARILGSVSDVIEKSFDNALDGAFEDFLGEYTFDINGLVTEVFPDVSTEADNTTPEYYAKQYGFNLVSITPDKAAYPYESNGLIFLPGEAVFDTDSLDAMIRYAYKLYTATQAISDDG